MTTLISAAPVQLIARNRSACGEHWSSLIGTGLEHLVIDFSETVYIDSLGLGLLLTLNQRARQRGTAFSLFGLTEDIQGILAPLTTTGAFATIIASLPEGERDPWRPLELGEHPTQMNVQPEFIPLRGGRGKEKDSIDDEPLKILRFTDSEAGDFRVWYRGELIDEKDATVRRLYENSAKRVRRLVIEIHSSDLSALLMRECIDDLMGSIVYGFTMPVEWTWAHDANRVASIELTRGMPDDALNLRVEFLADLGQWREPWTPREYRDAFAKVAKIDSVESAELHMPPSLPGTIVLTVEDLNTTNALNIVIDTCESVLRDAHHAVEHSLASQLRADSLVTHFRFPTEIRTACEQYLLYFVQFLHDLGIEADAELQHRAGEVLFSVTPEAGPDALERINAALSVYLDIPGRPNFDESMSGAQEPWLQGLTAQVYHLKGQLAMQANILQMKDTMLQMKDATITGLNSTIVDLQARETALMAMQSGTVVRDSLVEMSARGQQTDAEPLLGRSVSLIKWEKGPFQIDLRGFLREFKASFEDDDLPRPGKWF